MMAGFMTGAAADASGALARRAVRALATWLSTGRLRRPPTGAAGRSGYAVTGGADEAALAFVADDSAAADVARAAREHLVDGLAAAPDSLHQGNGAPAM